MSFGVIVYACQVSYLARGHVGGNGGGTHVVGRLPAGFLFPSPFLLSYPPFFLSFSFSRFSFLFRSSFLARSRVPRVSFARTQYHVTKIPVRRRSKSKNICNRKSTSFDLWGILYGEVPQRIFMATDCKPQSWIQHLYLLALLCIVWG